VDIIAPSEAEFGTSLASALLWITARSLRPVHHDQLKKSPCAINAEKKVPNGVFGDLLDDQGVAHNVFNVFRFTSCRSAERRTSTASIVLRNLLRWPISATAAAQA